MQASDIMTRDVVSVTPETPIREVARTLLVHGVSAAPVLDEAGAPVGMISEGDLVQRDDDARLARRDWWLKLLTEDPLRDGELLPHLGTSKRTARDVMIAPVLTISEQTRLVEIARLLNKSRIKRVPVVRDGRVVGIVSRADLLRAMALVEPTEMAHPAPKEEGHFLKEMIGLFMGSHPARHEPAAPTHDPTPAVAPPSLTAGTFRQLIKDFHRDEDRQKDLARRAAAEHRQLLAKELIDTHVSDEAWQDLLHRARKAAAAGLQECLVLRFPSELCADGGRMINIADENWPTSLRGEPAEIFLRWERDLKNRGFHLAARVLEFPGGKPGDIGLFLVWGEPE